MQTCSVGQRMWRRLLIRKKLCLELMRFVLDKFTFSTIFNVQVSASLCGEGDIDGIAPRLDLMDIDGLGDTFDTRDSDSEDEGIKEGRKRKIQVVNISSSYQLNLKIDHSRRSPRGVGWQCTSC